MVTKKQLFNVAFIVGFITALCFGCKKNDDSDNDFETGTVTDIDGNVYQTVKIGDQWWMAENLKVKRYRNGDNIPNIIDQTGYEWGNLETGALCSYKNLDLNIFTYGLLYNWYAVDDSRNIAPAGWHVPSDAEWDILIDFLGGKQIAGDKLKTAGITHWESPNDGTNESGFSALPAGYRSWNGVFSNLGHSACFWSSTDATHFYAWPRHLYHSYSSVLRDYNGSKLFGYSIRCVKD